MRNWKKVLGFFIVVALVVGTWNYLRYGEVVHCYNVGYYHCWSEE